MKPWYRAQDNAIARNLQAAREVQIAAGRVRNDRSARKRAGRREERAEKFTSPNGGSISLKERLTRGVEAVFVCEPMPLCGFVQKTSRVGAITCSSWGDDTERLNSFDFG